MLEETHYVSRDFTGKNFSENELDSIVFENVNFALLILKKQASVIVSSANVTFIMQIFLQQMCRGRSLIIVHCVMLI